LGSLGPVQSQSFFSLETELPSTKHDLRVKNLKNKTDTFNTEWRKKIEDKLREKREEVTASTCLADW